MEEADCPSRANWSLAGRLDGEDARKRIARRPILHPAPPILVTSGCSGGFDEERGSERTDRTSRRKGRVEELRNDRPLI